MVVKLDDDGEPHVYLRDILVKGEPLPKFLREAMENQDFTAGPPNQQRQPLLPRKLEKFEVRDGRITIVVAKEAK